MNRSSKILGIIIGILIGAFSIGAFIYFVVGVSYTPPAIKEYEFSGKVGLFENNMKAFSMSNHDVTLKISYRDSSDRTNSTARDMMVEQKSDTSDVVYHLVYIQRYHNEPTEVYLDDLHDEIHNTGGNSLDSAGAKQLFHDFKYKFLVRLERSDIILKPQFFNF